MLNAHTHEVASAAGGGRCGHGGGRAGSQARVDGEVQCGTRAEGEDPRRLLLVRHLGREGGIAPKPRARRGAEEAAKHGRRALGGAKAVARANGRFGRNCADGSAAGAAWKGGRKATRRAHARPAEPTAAEAGADCCVAEGGVGCGGLDPFARAGTPAGPPLYGLQGAASRHEQKQRGSVGSDSRRGEGEKGAGEGGWEHERRRGRPPYPPSTCAVAKRARGRM